MEAQPVELKCKKVVSINHTSSDTDKKILMLNYHKVFGLFFF